MPIAAIIGADEFYHANVHCKSLKRRGLVYGPTVVTEIQADQGNYAPCACWRVSGYVGWMKEDA